MNQEQTKAKNEQTDWEQEFEDFGNEAANRVKELVEEGKVRRLVVSRAGETLIDVPLLPAVIVGAIMTFWMPFVTMLAIVGAFIAKLKVEIVQVESVSTDIENTDITA